VQGESDFAAAEPPAPPQSPPTRAAIKDALTFCLDRLNDPTLLSDRIRIAIALLPFQHCKVGEIGKKERAQMEAERITGRFARPVTEDEAKWAKLLRS
jgi:hypothetical protein